MVDAYVYGHNNGLILGLTMGLQIVVEDVVGGGGGGGDGANSISGFFIETLIFGIPVEIE